MKLGLEMTHTFDPSWLKDSKHCIAQSVSNWILDEIDVIGKLLKESRHAHNFWAKSKEEESNTIDGMLV